MVEAVLYLGDCLDVMHDISDRSVDAIIADLPFGTTACKWDSVIPFESLWEHYKQIIKLKGVIVLFGMQPFTSALVMSNPEWFKYSIVWDKVLPTGHLCAKIKPMLRHLDILVFAQRTLGNFTYNLQMRKGELRKISHIGGGGKGGGMSVSGVYGTYRHAESYWSDMYYPTTIIRFSDAVRTGRQHPTQKHIKLMEYLVKTYSNPGDVVLDNVMGSGTTGVACMNLDRNFIGIELDPEYYAIAYRRIVEVCNE